MASIVSLAYFKGDPNIRLMSCFECLGHDYAAQVPR